MATIKNLSEQMSKAFEKRTRINGAEFWTLKDGSPEWMTNVCRAAHDDSDMAPDDWRYEFIVGALDAITEYEGDDEDIAEAVNEIEADVYTSRLTGWLHSRVSRIGWMDQAAESFGPFKSIFDHLQMAQNMEKEETFFQVLEALRDLATDENEAEEEEVDED
jgi:hypothetical protein